MGMDFDFLKAVGIEPDIGIEYTGREENYLSTLRRFYQSYDDNIKKMKDSLDSENLNDYMIYVHALKSNARMIGAIELSSLFETLEMGAKSGDKDIVSEFYDKALNMYKKTVEAIRPIGEADEEKASDEISAGEAKAAADELLEALDDFDDDKASFLARKLSGYPFKADYMNKLKEAEKYISEFNYDAATELIKEIYSVIG